MLWQHLRYGLRLLVRSPGFAIVVMLSLGLGIGANTAIFTLMNALLLRDLPVREPERLVQLSAVRPDAKVPVSYPMFRELERQQRVFTGLVGWGRGIMVNVEASGSLSREQIISVTGNAYSELGATPLFGRLLAPADSDPSTGASSQVAVLGYSFWQRRFGGAPDVVGRQIRVEGRPFTIVGVSRKWFSGMTPGQQPDITIPVTAYPSLVEGNEFTLENRSLLWLFVTGRLKDGVTIEQARAQLATVWPAVLRATVSTEDPGSRRDRFLAMGLELTPAAKGFSTGVRLGFARPLYVLSGIVALILLVACVNLANLMLARAAARSHEMGVRVAMGASRWSLARQVLTESLVLALSGAALGLVFAYWGTHFLVLLMTGNTAVPLSLDLTPDLSVLSATIALALVTGILFGMAPAWRASQTDPAIVIQRSARSLAGGAGKLSRILVITQVALSMVLLLGGGLLVNSFLKLRKVDLGFQKEGILQIELSPRPGGYQNLDINSYHRQLLDRISAVPGVTVASLSDLSIPEPESWHDAVSRAAADPSTTQHIFSNAAAVSPDFFQTLGIRILQGRSFQETDDEHHSRIAIMSASLARQLFPKGDAVGKSFHFGVMPDYQNLQIVGIAADTRLVNIREPSTPMSYFPSLQHPRPWGYLLVRTNQPPDTLSKVIAQQIDSLGREYALSTRTVAEVLSGELSEERVTGLLSGFFAALALLLASIGLYGLMSCAVTRRTREMGIRVALGAQREDVLWIVLREALALALSGLAVGIPCAIAACRLIGSMLFGLTSSDVPTISAVSILLLIVALIAGYLPALRASAIDPVVALRAE